MVVDKYGKGARIGATIGGVIGIPTSLYLLYSGFQAYEQGEIPVERELGYLASNIALLFLPFGTIKGGQALGANIEHHINNWNKK